MIVRRVNMAEIALIAGTRVALGVGIGLLLSGRISDEHRRAAGLSLVIAGALSTIPLAIRVLTKDGVAGDIPTAA